MGIRVNAESMDRQLSLAGCDARRTLPSTRRCSPGSCPILWAAVSGSPPVHAAVGQRSIGEVRSSIWDEETRRICAERGVTLL